MEFSGEIEIDQEHLDVLMDYCNDYSLDSEYFELQDKQDIENEMTNLGLLDGGFYQHYPLSPTPLANLIVNLYRRKNVKIS